MIALMRVDFPAFGRPMIATYQTLGMIFMSETFSDFINLFPHHFRGSNRIVSHLNIVIKNHYWSLFASTLAQTGFNGGNIVRKMIEFCI
jgi:hypothetical protein